jgi:hypothetical protein
MNKLAILVWSNPKCDEGVIAPRLSVQILDITLLNLRELFVYYLPVVKVFFQMNLLVIQVHDYLSVQVRFQEFNVIF